MLSRFNVGVLIAALVFASAPASAQSGASPEVAALGQCLSDRSTGADRVILVRWFVVALAAAPQLDGIAEVKPETRTTIDRALAATFTRLLTVDCLDQSRAVASNSGEAGFKIAGQTFGRIAMREILNDPKAEAAMGTFATYMNDADFAKLKSTK